MAKPLTAAACRKFAPGRERRRVRDGGARSLYLVIEPSGFKAFEMRFRTSGRIAKIRLGPLDLSGKESIGEPQIGAPLSLQAARTLAAEVLRQKAAGRDPIADRKSRKHAKRLELKEGQQNAFPIVVRDFIREASPRLRRWADLSRTLGLKFCDDRAEPEIISGSLCDRWRDKPAAAVTSDDIWSAVSEALHHAVPGRPARNKQMSAARGRSLHASLSRLFAWAQRTRRVTANPVSDVHPPAPPLKARDRVLSDSELKVLWTATDPTHEPLFGAPTRLLLLLGQRLGEVVGMRATELSQDANGNVIWSLPGNRTKNGRPHTIALPKLGCDILASVPRSGDLVFSTNTSRPISGWSKASRRIAARMASIARKEIPEWRLHDLRRTAATGMAEIGIPPHIVEACLNHVSGAKSGVAGTYNRAAYGPEKKVALERWAAHIEGIVTGSKPAEAAANVITLAAGKKRGRK